MATINAARALGLDAEIGSLEAGKLADIAIFDLKTPHAAPANNPISNFVSSAHGTDAHTVFVNGREIVSAGELKTFADIGGLIGAATARAQEIVQKAGLATRTQPVWPTSTQQ